MEDPVHYLYEENHTEGYETICTLFSNNDLNVLYLLWLTAISLYRKSAYIHV